MADSSILTYEQDPPRRATLDDLDGGNCEDDPRELPVPGQDPSADAMNQRDKLIVALCAMVGAAWLHVTFSGGTATKAAVGGMRQGGAALVVGDFTLVENATGDTTITHAGGKLPPKMWPAFAVLVGDGDTTITCTPVTNGARIRTRTGGTLADVDFLVFFSGV